jgi:hypothetical protein
MCACMHVLVALIYMNMCDQRKTSEGLVDSESDVYVCMYVCVYV